MHSSCDREHQHEERSAEKKPGHSTGSWWNGLQAARANVETASASNRGLRMTLREACGSRSLVGRVECGEQRPPAPVLTRWTMNDTAYHPLGQRRRVMRGQRVALISIPSSDTGRTWRRLWVVMQRRHMKRHPRRRVKRQPNDRARPCAVGPTERRGPPSAGE